MHTNLNQIEPIVIASILKNPKWIRLAAAKLDSEDFEKEYLGDIFHQMLILHKRKKIPTEVAVRACLDDDDIIDLVNETAFPEEDEEVFCQYVDDLHNAGTFSLAEESIEEALEKVRNREFENLNELGLAIRKVNSEVSEKTYRGNTSTSKAKELVEIFSQDMKERASTDDLIKGTRTGFDDLDKAINGMNGGNYIVVAGRPGMGKTTLAMNIAENVARNGGNPLVFSMEMPKSQLMRRFFASMASVETNKIKTAQFSAHEAAAIKQAMEDLSEWDLVISDEGGMTLQQFENTVIQEHEEKPLSCVVLDYIQLMSTQGVEGNTRSEKIGNISNAIKKLALNLNIPIIVLSQLNRDVESRPDKRPMPSDLRDAGAIEQDADIIIFTYRDEVYDPDTPDKGFGEIIIAKQRDGELATIRAIFEGWFSRFRNIDKETPQEAVQNQPKSLVL